MVQYLPINKKHMKHLLRTTKKGLIVMKLSRLINIMLGIFLAGAGQQASAYTDYWSLNCSSPGGSRCSADTEYSTSAVNSIQAEVTAWGNNGSGNTYTARSLHEYSGGLGSGASEGEGNPGHAFDNNGVHEFALIEFDMSVALEGINLGWTYSDEDVSILAYTDTTFDVNSDLAGNTQSQLSSNGWSSVANFDAGGTGWAFFNTGANQVSSQYWLVGAYSSVFGNLSSNHGGGYDYFKLDGLKGTYTPRNDVSAPGTTALMLLGLGLAAIRRKRS